MTIDYDKLMKYRVSGVEQTLSIRDTMLYALGVGLGHDPMNEAELQFVYEKDLHALPTMATVLGYINDWLGKADAGVDRVRTVNGGSSFTIHKALPVEGTLVGEASVVNVIDKGPGKGALVLGERKVFDKASGDHLCTIATTTFCRGQGGFGGPDGPLRPLQAIPDREPDLVCDLPTLPQSALIYRLSGDYNPLHAEPARAKTAGFERPIAHGLLTYGVAGHALLKTCCGYDTSRFKGMEGRFTAPVFPGDTIRTEMWRDGDEVTFRAVVTDRDAVVIDNGRAEISG